MINGPRCRSQLLRTPCCERFLPPSLCPSVASTQSCVLGISFRWEVVFWGWQEQQLRPSGELIPASSNPPAKADSTCEWVADSAPGRKAGSKWKGAACQVLDRKRKLPGEVTLPVWQQRHGNEVDHKSLERDPKTPMGQTYKCSLHFLFRF